MLTDIVLVLGMVQTRAIAKKLLKEILLFSGEKKVSSDCLDDLELYKQESRCF